MELKQIKEYYETADLFLPENPQWRFFVFKWKDKRVKRFHLKDREELRKLLIKYLPDKVYFSAGAWLNVENVRGKKLNNYPIKIYEDIIFDIDADKLTDIRRASLNIIQRIGEPDKIVKTTRGVHLWYLKNTHKKEYLEKLGGIKYLDIKCTENEFNVFALPKTLKDGKICDFITIQQLHGLFDEEDTSKRRKANEEAERHPRGKISSQRMRSEMSKGRAGIEGTAFSFNNIVKPKIFIPILIYKKSYPRLKKEIIYLIKHYDLGTAYTFLNERNVAFIFLKCMEARRLEKILNSSNCLNKLQFKKFNKLWFDFSEYKSPIQIEYNTKKLFLRSQKHSLVLEKFGFKIFKQDKEVLVGNSKIKIFEVKKI